MILPFMKTKEIMDYLDTKIGRFNKDSSVDTIYVGNLSYDYTELDIKDLFEEFGYVSYVKLIKDPNTYESKGIAFVQMPHANHARAAIKNLNDSIIEGRNLKVSIAVENNKNGVVAKVARKRRKPYKPYVSKAERAAAAAKIASTNL